MKNFEVDRVKFAAAMGKLALSKLYNQYFKAEHTELYYQDLKSLRYIIEVLTNARQKEYKTRMPLVSDLIEDHRKYVERRFIKRTSTDYLETKRRIDYKGGSLKKAGEIPEGIMKEIRKKLGKN